MGAQQREPEYQTHKIVKGPPKRPDGYKPSCSIPAKFETVLYQGPRERKGFGSEVKRFGDSDTDIPGPGTYVKIGNTLEYSHDSISKKGYGTMVSKDQRFRRKVVYTGPGPGEYKNRNADETSRDKYFNKAGATAGFIKEGSKSIGSPEEAATPGPGTYEITETRVGQKLDMLSTAQSHKSAFKTTPHKLILSGNLETPGPTKYSLGDLWDAKSMTKGCSRSPSKAASSSFAGRSITSLGAMSPLMFLEGPDAQKPDGGPGPGSYELQSFQSIKQGLDRGVGKTSSSFQKPEYVDRFNRPLAKPAPSTPQVACVMTSQGQGVRIPSPEKGVSAPFKSQSAGHNDYDLKEATKAPGPAYYSPQKPAKASFHLNARKNFVKS